MIKKADIVFSAALLIVFGIIIAAFFLFGKSGGYAVVKQNGKVICRMPLDKDDELTIYDDANGYNVVEVSGGKAIVKSADCRDQICVNHIAISKEGETIVCLPHKLVVEVE